MWVSIYKAVISPLHLDAFKEAYKSIWNCHLWSDCKVLWHKLFEVQVQVRLILGDALKSIDDKVMVMKGWGYVIAGPGFDSNLLHSHRGLFSGCFNHSSCRWGAPFLALQTKVRHLLVQKSCNFARNSLLIILMSFSPACISFYFISERQIIMFCRKEATSHCLLVNLRLIWLLTCSLSKFSIHHFF